jgi:hypothetical protein
MDTGMGSLCEHKDTVSGVPCQNPVNPGTTQCAAGHDAAHYGAPVDLAEMSALAPAGAAFDMDGLVAPAPSNAEPSVQEIRAKADEIHDAVMAAERSVKGWEPQDGFAVLDPPTAHDSSATTGGAQPRLQALERCGSSKTGRYTSFGYVDGDGAEATGFQVTTSNRRWVGKPHHGHIRTDATVFFTDVHAGHPNPSTHIDAAEAALMAAGYEVVRESGGGMMHLKVWKAP